MPSRRAVTLKERDWAAVVIGVAAALISTVYAFTGPGQQGGQEAQTASRLATAGVSATVVHVTELIEGVTGVPRRIRVTALFSTPDDGRSQVAHPGDAAAAVSQQADLLLIDPYDGLPGSAAGPYVDQRGRYTVPFTIRYDPRNPAVAVAVVDQDRFPKPASRTGWLAGSVLFAAVAAVGGFRLRRRTRMAESVIAEVDRLEALRYEKARSRVYRIG